MSSKLTVKGYSAGRWHPEMVGRSKLWVGVWGTLNQEEYWGEKHCVS